MKKNQRVRVKQTAPHHAGRVGYFQFAGEGSSEGTVVLAEEPDKLGKPQTLFAVDSHNIAVEAH